MKQLLIATKNPGKFIEITEGLGQSGLGDTIKFLSLTDMGLNDEVEEHGTTHKENAVLKARHFYRKTGLPVLGEDSGIHVDALPGELGVQTRRWGGLEKASDSEWIAYFLKKMEPFGEAHRGAEFVCFAALILDDISYEKPYIFSGKTRGVITKTLEAPLRPGIPISSCFRPDGLKKVYAALTVEEKNRISHRGKAMQQVKQMIVI